MNHPKPTNNRMNTIPKPFIAAGLALALSTLNPQPSTVFAQGSLTPPGAPAPTMKTLAQIEARTPISSAPFTISVPGSYYLITNLTVRSGDAIAIATNGVTLDLNGFTLSSTANPANGNGVLLTGSLSDITIANGHIRGGVTNNAGTYGGPGFMHGISYSSGALLNTRVVGVTVAGCQHYGIYLGIGHSTVVESCTVRTVGSYGIFATTIKNSTASDCGLPAIYGSQVSDCRGQSSNDYGISANTAQNCYGYSSSSSAIGLSANTAQNCYGYSSSSGIGLNAYTAQNCYGYSSSGTALSAQTALNCYGESGSGTALSALTAQNCYGSSSSSTGLSATTAQNCYGYSNSGTGLYANTAHNCYGYSVSDSGLFADRTATGCYGYSFSGPRGLYARSANTCVGYRTGGRAIEATVANGCYAQSGTNFITYKYNMP